MAYRSVGKGDRVSEYLLVEKLGVGGFGEVWKAEHVQIPGKYVAIKIPTSPDSMDLLKKEAVFQHQLDHPNIVKTIGLDTQHDPPYFMMEYVDGKNLRQRMMEDGILPPPYAIDIAVQVLEALAYAHSKNIVHKDVKPENILVEKRRVSVADKGKALMHYVKITDLGLGMFPGRSDSAIVVSEYARTSGMRLMSGTLFYMAPEQMVPGRSVDTRADVYSLGVVLYEMLTGELPLGMDLPSELNPVVTPELDAICKKALSIDRDIRYQTVQEMASDLQRAKEIFLLKLVQAGAPSIDLNPQIKRLTPRSVPLPNPILQPRGRRRATRIMEWALLFVVFALLGGSLWTFTRLYKNARERNADPKTAAGRVLGGPIRISSEPDGAIVAVNGVEVGASPVEITRAFHSRTEIRLSMPFHQDRVIILDPRFQGDRLMFAVIDGATGREQALLDATKGMSLERLALQREKGGLSVQALNVQNATVRIDGVMMGPTPFEMQVPAGRHTVKIEKEGFESFEESIEIYAHSTTMLRIPLLPAGSKPATTSAGPARLLITSDPPGATIVIDQTEKGVTPATIELPPGEYDLRLVKEFYQTHEQKKMTVTATLTKEVVITLNRVRAQATFDSEPRGASVTLDGKPIGTTPVMLEALEGGEHEAVFKLEGCYEQKVPFKISDGTPFELTCKDFKKVPSASLSVMCDVDGIAVLVDDAVVGRTPLAAHVIKAGKYRVRVMDVEREITLDPGQMKTERFSGYDLRIVSVTAGEFTYGTRLGQPGQHSQRKETLAAFYADKYEVTNAQYAVFLKQSANHSKCHKDEPKNKDHTPEFWNDKELNGPKQPVVGVDYWDAYAYASWAGKRLPTEKEWEKAARGVRGFTFPWGNQWDPTRLNWGEFTQKNYLLTAPVGSFPEGASADYGCYDMAGNAAEWTADDFEPNSNSKTVRGGSYLNREESLMTYSRQGESMNKRAKWLGFRCVADPK